MGVTASGVPSFKQKTEEHTAAKLRDFVAQKIVRGRLVNREEAAPRWAWELIQNARDAAEHWKRTFLVHFTHTADQLTLRHTGGPFAWEHVDALLHAGSSKSFEPDSTDVGRFGTGFLVTQAISGLVTVSGIMVIDGYHRPFRVQVDRRGTETNVKDKLEDAIAQVDTPVDGVGDESVFVYEQVDTVGTAVVRKGLLLVDEVAPYLFAFNDRLAEIRIEEEGRTIRWERGEATSSPPDLVKLLLVRHEERRPADGAASGEQPDPRVEFEVYRGDLAGRGFAAAVVRCRKERVLVPPTAHHPRLYVHLPLVKSECARLPVVVHAPFRVENQRSVECLAADCEKPPDSGHPSAAYENQELTKALLAALPPFMAHVARSAVTAAHEAVRLSLPDGELRETKYWKQSLATLLKALDDKPLVRSKDDPSGYLPPNKCQFLEAQVLGTCTLDLRRFRNLVSALNIPVPNETTVAPWATIFPEWRKVEPTVPKCVWGLKDLLEYAKNRKTLTGLGELLQKKGAMPPIEWLLGLLELVGPLAAELPSHLLDLLWLPDQDGHLKPCAELQFDDGIDEDLKRLAHDLGKPLRPQLLDLRLHGDSPAVRSLLESRLRGRMSEAHALKLVTDHARTALNEQDAALKNKGWQQDSPLIRQTAQLLLWLAGRRTEHPAYGKHALEFRILTDKGTLLAAGEKLGCLLPVKAWRDLPDRFADLFPEGKRLASAYYYTAGASWGVLEAALIEWEICYPGPLMVGDVPLKGKYVKTLLLNPADALSVSDSADYTCPGCSYIPFLTPDVIGRVSMDSERAKLLLSFLMTQVVEKDPRWRGNPPATVTTAKGSQVLRLRASEWLAHIRRDSWVPLLEGDGDPVPATRESLRGLVCWEDVGTAPVRAEFLQLLGFDRLEVFIQSSARGDEAQEREVRDQLAEVIHTARSMDLTLPQLRSMLEERHQNKQRVATNRTRGLHVQELVRQALKRRGKEADVIDRGYDLDVYELDDCGDCEVGHYYLEVKATLTDEVRLTPLQAQTAVAKPARFFLCVVALDPLRSEPASMEEVSRSLLVVGGLDFWLKPLLENVNAATSSGTGVWVDKSDQLRYCVHVSVWKGGQGLEEWIDAVF